MPDGLDSLAVAIAGSVTISSWRALVAGNLLAGLIALIAIRRHVDVGRVSATMILLGLVVLAMAAGGLTWKAAEQGEVAVMVDLSPSTRTAQYRAVETLRRRVGQLLGTTRYRMIYFAAENRAKVAEGAVLDDLAAERTVFSPAPGAKAIVLFSDAQFDLPPLSPPVFAAVDPSLQDAPDAAVKRLEIRGKTLVAVVGNHGNQARQVVLSTGDIRTVANGTIVVTTPLHEGTSDVGARLMGKDAWPENDALAIRVPPAIATERWWIGASRPTSDWNVIDPAKLPDEAADYLRPSVIVLDNVAATDLMELQQQRLEQYARDLGGAIVIGGGDRAFAAGAYGGTTLEKLSPLASDPPTPTMHWIILGDSSGSMATRDASMTRWQQVRTAMVKLLPSLPPEDPVTIGSFAENLRWWSLGKSAKETAGMALPPPEVRPYGPTNLEDAMLKLIAAADTAMPKELLLLTDADAQVTKLDELRRGLIEKKIRLDLLALREDGRALGQLEELSRATGGQSIRELVPAKWTQAIRKLYAKVGADRLVKQPVPVRFLGDWAGLAPREVGVWNRTWLKKGAAAMAQSDTAEGNLAMAGRWRVGAGEVVAVAFGANPAEVEQIANLVAQPPRDPRFRINWETGTDLRVTIDAVDGNTYLNGLSLELGISAPPPAASTPRVLPIPQTGPGRYALAVESPREPAFAAVRQGNRVLDRTAVAGRYAREFDAIGNNVEAMKELARRSGGRMIPPTQTKAIEFDWPTRDVPLTSWLATAGAMLIAGGLLRWRLG
ncbi:MAG: VWA domain-containing protein [Planctomycetota bacterium]|nr:VWA domain-containing protein [Planctomycetota bacterium]